MKGHSRPSRKLCDLIETLTNSSNITRAARWLADQQRSQGSQSWRTLHEVASRLCLTDADAAEAILLAGNFSICRRAFG